MAALQGHSNSGVLPAWNRTTVITWTQGRRGIMRKPLTAASLLLKQPIRLKTNRLVMWSSHCWTHKEAVVLLVISPSCSAQTLPVVSVPLLLFSSASQVLHRNYYVLLPCVGQGKFYFKHENIIKWWCFIFQYLYKASLYRTTIYRRLRIQRSKWNFYIEYRENHRHICDSLNHVIITFKTGSSPACLFDYTPHL